MMDVLEHGQVPEDTEAVTAQTHNRRRQQQRRQQQRQRQQRVGPEQGEGVIVVDYEEPASSDSDEDDYVLSSDGEEQRVRGVSRRGRVLRRNRTYQDSDRERGPYT
jgi:transcription initiation factor TFIID subunit TAF12